MILSFPLSLRPFVKIVRDFSFIIIISSSSTIMYVCLPVIYLFPFTEYYW